MVEVSESCHFGVSLFFFFFSKKKILLLARSMKRFNIVNCEDVLFCFFLVENIKDK